MGMPGFVQAGTYTPCWMRQLVFGPPKSGKSVYCGTWPSPLFIHPVVESGYDTFRLPDGTNLFPYVKLGESQAQWMTQDRGKETVPCASEELRQWIRWFALNIGNGCPYQTVVLGGFNVLQSLVIAEAQKVRKGSDNKYSVWEYVLSWSTELIQTLFTLPIHVIIECGADNIAKEVQATTKASPSISGKTYQNLLSDVNVILWQECTNGRYFTFVSTGKSQVNGVRFAHLNTPLPVENCCYDWFAQSLGLPPIYRADPRHPRVQHAGTPKWPWVHPTF